MGTLDVFLVGRRLPHNENLGLGYLRAALRGADRSERVAYVNDVQELCAAAAQILRARPRIVGLSLADGGSALLPLTLGELLRRGGYGGHICCGGQFATLSRSWLLERYEWIDSVVRFAGEVPLVELVSRLERGLPAAGTAGLTTREGDGPPAPVLDPTPLAIWPVHDELPRVAGYPAAHVAGSRGCRGRCRYCGPAALYSLEQREGLRSGADRRALRAAGVGGLKSRSVEAIADEMAALWHERGVRYFYFVDEHLLPYRRDEALAFLAHWSEALAERQVGELGIGCMLRADRIDADVIAAFAELGLVRCFVGLELAGGAEGRKFGRPAPRPEDLALLGSFAEHGVATVSNLMLVHPHSTAQSIEAGIELLARLPAGVFEATRMQIYHGTELHRRMQAEGRVEGSPLRYGYRIEEPVAARFSELFTRLRGQAFRDYSVAYRTHDTHLALALGARIRGDRPAREALAALDTTRRRLNALYVSAYRQALALAEDGFGFGDGDALVERARREADALGAQLDELERTAHASLPRGRPGAYGAFAPTRAAAAGVISFVMLAASSGGCALSHRGEGAGGDAAARDGAPDAARDAAPPDARADAGGCTDSDHELAAAQIPRIARDSDACFSGMAGYRGEAAPPEAIFSVDAYGASGLAFRTCHIPADAEAMSERVRVGLAERRPECASRIVPIGGDAQADMNQLALELERAGLACGASSADGSLRVVLGPAGEVVDLIAVDPMVRECGLRVLEGLSFPCLANFEVCPEFVIAE